MGGWNPQLDELLAEDEHGITLTQVRPYVHFDPLLSCHSVQGSCVSCLEALNACSNPSETGQLDVFSC